MHRATESVLAGLVLLAGAGPAGGQQPAPAPPRAASTHAPTQAELDRAADASDWPTPEHDYAGTKYSPLRQLTRATVARLQAVCVYQVSGLENFQAMPIVYRGVMYVTTARLTLALDARTCRFGTLRWYRQMVPHDTHDWDLTHAGPLFSSIVGGKPRDLIATAGKDGVLRTVDRTTHEIRYETAVTTREGVETPVAATGPRACPGFWGGVQWNGPAYSPRLQTLFVNAVDWCATYKLDQELRRARGRNHLGGAARQSRSTAEAARCCTASTPAARSAVA